MKRILALAILALFGCMQPDVTNAPSTDSGSGVEDQDLLAGATSSTNWPQEDGGSKPVFISGRADSVLELYFKKEDSTPQLLSGKITLFRAAVIPALDSVPTQEITFPNSDTLRLKESFFTSLKEAGTDTVSFTIRVETDSLQCLLLGFSYSMKDKKFLSSPFSVFSTNPFLLTSPKFFFKGIADSSFEKTGITSQGKTEWCFYIPGSPYFWKANLDDTLRIGPIPYGIFPLRLLRVTHPDGYQEKNLLEVFEAKVVLNFPDAQHHDTFFTVMIGDKILSHVSETPIVIRSEIH